MRAIPSPTSMTRPASCRSTSASYPSSWRLMISLISSALIIVLSPCQPFAQARQLSVETAVENEAADLSHEAAQERGIELLIDNDALAQHLLEPLAEPPLVLVREAHCRAHRGTGLTEVFVEQRAVRPEDLGEMIGTAALGDDAGEIL